MWKKPTNLSIRKYLINLLTSCSKWTRALISNLCKRKPEVIKTLIIFMFVFQMTNSIWMKKINPKNSEKIEQSMKHNVKFERKFNSMKWLNWKLSRWTWDRKMVELPLGWYQKNFRETVITEECVIAKNFVLYSCRREFVW